jgi:hypothetical protein
MLTLKRVVLSHKPRLPCMERLYVTNSPPHHVQSLPCVCVVSINHFPNSHDIKGWVSHAEAELTRVYADKARLEKSSVDHFAYRRLS